MFNTREGQLATDEIRTEYPSFNVRSLTPHIGAEVEGVDLARPLSNEQARDIHDAWMDWKVLVFHDQELSRDQHKAFGRRFGRLHVHSDAASVRWGSRDSHRQDHSGVTLYARRRLAHRCDLR